MGSSGVGRSERDPLPLLGLLLKGCPGHRRLSAVLYHSFWDGSMLPTPHLLWLNPSAPTRGLLERLFRSAFDLALVE